MLCPYCNRYNLVDGKCPFCHGERFSGAKREANSKIIKGLDGVVKHLVDECADNRLSNKEFARLNVAIHAAIKRLETCE